MVGWVDAWINTNNTNNTNSKALRAESNRRETGKQLTVITFDCQCLPKWKTQPEHKTTDSDGDVDRQDADADDGAQPLIELDHFTLYCQLWHSTRSLSLFLCLLPSPSPSSRSIVCLQFHQIARRYCSPMKLRKLEKLFGNKQLLSFSYYYYY